MRAAREDRKQDRNLQDERGRPPAGATLSRVRQANRVALLNLVRLHQPIARVDLSRLTGMFRSSVSAIVDELIADGLLIEERAEPRGRGRVPLMLSLNSRDWLVLAVSIRRFTTQVVSAGLDAEIQKTVSFPTPSVPEELLEELGAALALVRGTESKPFRRVGVSVPGFADSASGRITMLPSLPGYAGFTIAAEIERLAGAPVAVENDANLGALAQVWLRGHGRQADGDFVLIEIADVGVGSGVVLDGRLYTGHDGKFAGEFGHAIVDASGPECTCGRRGCWEQFVSDRASWRHFDPSTEYTPARFESLLQLALDGDAKAREAFERTATYLSLGLSNIQLALNPKRIVLVGRITRIWHLIHDTVETACFPDNLRSQIEPLGATLDELSLRGAIALALESQFTSPEVGWSGFSRRPGPAQPDETDSSAPEKPAEGARPPGRPF